MTCERVMELPKNRACEYVPAGDGLLHASKAATLIAEPFALEQVRRKSVIKVGAIGMRFISLLLPVTVASVAHEPDPFFASTMKFT